MGVHRIRRGGPALLPARHGLAEVHLHDVHLLRDVPHAPDRALLGQHPRPGPLRGSGRGGHVRRGHRSRLPRLKVLSIFVFGFTCHQNIFGVTNELRDPTQRRIDTVILLSIGVSYCVYMIVAACGYHTFGDEVEADILVSYPKAYFTSLSRFLLSVAAAFTYPLQCHPCRNSILSILDHWDAYRLGTPVDALGGGASASSTSEPLLVKEKREEDEGEGYEGCKGQRTTSTAPPEPGQHLTERERTIRFVAVTAAFLGLSLLLALTVSDLSVVLALVGATGSTVMSYIVPGFAYYILFQDEGPVWKRNLALFLGRTGLVLVPLCLTFIFI